MAFSIQLYILLYTVFLVSGQQRSDAQSNRVCAVGICSKDLFSLVVVKVLSVVGTQMSSVFVELNSLDFVSFLEEVGYKEKYMSSRKHAYIIFIPLNPTFV